MTDRTIPQRELRNNISAVLHAAEAGQTFTVTIRGRPVARVVPPGDPAQPRTDVDRETIRRILAAPIDDELEAQLDAAEAPSMNQLCSNTEAGPLDFPLHPGAERYYRKKGYL